jgi:protein-disulfide isomerase
LIDDEFVASGQVKYVVQPFYLWDWSRPIAEAALCAREQDGFWDFHHLAFVNSQQFPVQRAPSRDTLRELAQASGLDVNAFDACINEGRYLDEIVASREDARLRGINSTPSIFINGARTASSIEAIRRAVQAALAASAE